MTYKTVIPEVQLIPSSTKASIGNTISLFCNVTRTNPETISYTWTHQDSGRVLALQSNLDSLVLTFALEEEFGTYSCIVRNAVNFSGSANVTLEEGCKNIIN